MKRVVLFALCCLACSQSSQDGPTAFVVLESDRSVSADQLSVEPAGAVIAAEQEGAALKLQVNLGAAGKHLRIQVPDMCPVHVDLTKMKPDEKQSAPLVPLLDFGEAQAQLGYGQRFSIQVEPGCTQAGRGTIDWSVLDDKDVAEMVVGERGFSISGRLPGLRESLGPELPWGVVPIAPRTQGLLRLTASFKDPRRDGPPANTIVTVAAAARATGLPNLPVGQRIYLGGEGWQLGEKPDDAAAELQAIEGVASLMPDMAGHWKLVDAKDRSLSLMVGPLDQTPLDCGRSGCHPSETQSVQDSAMTTTWKRLLGQDDDSFAAAAKAHGMPDADRNCAIACHTVGEVGVDDGGYHDLAGQLALAGVHGSDWQTLPSALRRLSGVGCLACHGPAAVPEPDARWAILGTGVCATCHDAPPTYGHVAAWQNSPMATADRDEMARTEAACVRCHTGWGAIGAERRPPEHTMAGLGCAVCHDVHPQKGTDQQANLLRDIDYPPFLKPIPPSAGRSQVCLSCHAPRLDEGTPRAAAAAIWLGKGGLDPQTGDALVGVAPHVAVGGGCVGCHRGGSGRGDNHQFKADPKSDPGACRLCHPPNRDRRPIAERARSLWQQLQGQPYDTERTLHAHADTPTPPSTPRARAQWNLRLVLEDEAAAVHNAIYASQLLDSVDKLLDSQPPVPDDAGDRPSPEAKRTLP